MNSSENPFSNLDEETQVKIQEVQIKDQEFQQLILQKRNFKYELDEVDYALKELDKSEGEVSKIVAGAIIIKTDKETLTKELNRKKELIELRLKSIDSEEKELSKEVELLRDEVMKKLTPKKPE